MGTKTISIMNDVYKLLVRNKMENESFSDVIRRTLSKRKDIIRFAGAWSEMSDEEVEGMKERIEKLRKRSTKDLVGSGK